MLDGIAPADLHDQPSRRMTSSCLRPARASRDHDTRRRHAMTPGLVGQTIEQAAGHPRMPAGWAGAKAKPASCGQVSWCPMAGWRGGLSPWLPWDW
jgi:hypothetical protein